MQQERTAYVTNYREYMDNWQLFKDKLPLHFSYEEIKCKFCKSQRVTKYGRYKDIQRWWCKECGRKFVHNGALPGMKTPLGQIESAMKMYYQGGSISSIRKQLDRDFGYYPSDSTLYGWISRFKGLTTGKTNGEVPRVGDVWAINAVRPQGKKYWIMDVLDAKTLFLLAIEITNRNNAAAIRHVIESSAEVARKAPEKIVNCSRDENDSLDLTLDSDSREIEVVPFDRERDVNLEKSWQSIHRIIKRIVRGKNRGSTQLIVSGWINYYNFVRHNEALGGRTPAEACGVGLVPLS